MDLKINTEKLIKDYQNGLSLNVLAQMYGTYPMTIKRILEKNNVELRHDNRKAGEYYVEEGEKLIEWAKAQGRLVTRAELAAVIGTKRLSSSYFKKYPELNHYLKTHEQSDLEVYTQKLYDWLQENNIPYSPNNRERLKVTVTALLLGEYKDIALQIKIKPKCLSKHVFEQRMAKKHYRAGFDNVSIIFINESNFKNLDYLKVILDKIKRGEK